MQDRPRVGLILMRSEWKDWCAQEEVAGSIEADAQKVIDAIAGRFTIQGTWAVSSNQSLQECRLALRDTDLDMVILAYQTWAEDTRLVSLLQSIGSRPLVLWCYLPWRRLPHVVPYIDLLRGSGPIGTLAALGTLRNLGRPFLFTYGAPDDPRLIHDLIVAGRAAAARKALRSTRFGLIPSRNEQMQVNFVDEFRLMADFGPVVQYLSVSELKRIVDAVDPDKVKAYLHRLCELFPVHHVTEEALELNARTVLGLEQVALANHLDVVVVNDEQPELRRTIRTRPGLYPDLSQADDTLYLPGGDLGAATAAFILQHLTASPVFFMELWFWDEAMNQLVGGHGGLQNPGVAAAGQAWIGPDFGAACQEGFAGVQMQMVARPGRVTLFQLRSTPSGWQAVAASGVCLEGQPVVEGYPHAILRLDAPVSHFLHEIAEVGASQHWVMAYGSVLNEIEAFCQIQSVPLALVKY